MSVQRSEFDVQRSAPKGAVFLSYASQDSEAAKRIADALRAAGVEVWFDQNELRGGDSWDQKIRKQIKECALFVPVISANTQSRTEGYFRLEWKLAVDRSHLMADDAAFLFPVVIDGTTDGEARVPEKFRDVQWTRAPRGETSPAVATLFQRLLGGAAVSTAASKGAAARVEASAPAPGTNSVAVLAFANLSNDPENEFFSDGVSEELINVLVRVPGLKVSARTSAFHFKGRNTPIPEIARQLGVAYVVEGSVRKAGERVRITAQLIKAADGFHLWSENFTRDLKDIFAVQDEIAELIAKQLQVRLASGAHSAREVNPEAFQAYLQGRQHMNTYAVEGFTRAIEVLRGAVQIDPSFAPAWAALSQAASMRGGYSQNVKELNDCFTQAREGAERALALDPELPAAHLALAKLQSWHDFDWKGAAASLRRAQALAPADVNVIHGQAELNFTFGRADLAVGFARQAVALDPVNNAMRLTLAYSLGFGGHFAEAEPEFRRIIELSPNATWGHGGIGVLYLFQGRFAEAEREAVQEVPEFSRLFVLTAAQWGLKKFQEADETLALLTQKFADVAAYQVAQIRAFRGESDKAFEWLERARDQRDPGVAWCRSDMFMHSIHEDPRWEQFLRKLGLADDQLP